MKWFEISIIMYSSSISVRNSEKVGLGVLAETLEAGVRCRLVWLKLVVHPHSGSLTSEQVDVGKIVPLQRDFSKELFVCLHNMEVGFPQSKKSKRSSRSGNTMYHIASEVTHHILLILLASHDYIWERCIQGCEYWEGTQEIVLFCCYPFTLIVSSFPPFGVRILRYSTSFSRVVEYDSAPWSTPVAIPGMRRLGEEEKNSISQILF